jgi:hypothetical protein
MKDFENFVREKSREIAPDYPGIEKDLEIWEHFWAITSSYEGTEMANKDLHNFISFLLNQLGWTNLHAIQEWEKYKELKSCV